MNGPPATYSPPCTRKKKRRDSVVASPSSSKSRGIPTDGPRLPNLYSPPFTREKKRRQSLSIVGPPPSSSSSCSSLLSLEIQVESYRPSYSPPFTRLKRRKSLQAGSPSSLSLGIATLNNHRKRSRTHKKNQDLQSIVEDELSVDDDYSHDGPAFVELPIVLSESLINDKTMELFGLGGFFPSLEDATSVDPPRRSSIAASLFSTFALLNNKTEKSLASVLPLLKSLVGVEIVFMGETAARKRTVRFASIDGSCILPPVDRDPNSLLPQQGAIEALQEAIESVLALSSAATPVLRELEEFLYTSKTTEIVSLGIVDCSIQQFRAHVSTYRDDFRVIIHRLSTLPNEAITPVKQAALRQVEQPLKSIEVLLAKHIGRAIRYHLRMLFNKVPPNISSNTTHPNLDRYSNIWDFVAFQGYDDDDSSSSVIISSMVSRCLRVLCDSFGMASLMGHGCITLPTSFFISPASLLMIPAKGQPFVCTDEDANIVEGEIVFALEFIEAARACKFLVDLWDHPGVKEELDRVGGLDLVETYASMSWNYDLYSICPEDGHLVPLCNVTELISRLRNLNASMEPLAETALYGAQTVAKNFRFATKSKTILRAYPLIRRLKHVYDETMHTAEKIPIIVKE